MYLSDFLTCIMILLTAGLLRVAWLAYKKLLMQEARKAQLKVVVEYIKILVDFDFDLFLVEKPHAGSIELSNLFQIAEYQIPEDKLMYPVYLLNDYHFDLFQILDISNPLIPTDIANALINFKALLFEVDDTERRQYYRIGKSFQDGIIPEFYTVRSFDGGITALVTSCKQISDAFFAWLSRNGVKDINSRGLVVTFRN
jgi:hypothetical protein